MPDSFCEFLDARLLGGDDQNVGGSRPLKIFDLEAWLPKHSHLFAGNLLYPQPRQVDFRIGDLRTLASAHGTLLLGQKRKVATVGRPAKAIDAGLFLGERVGLAAIIANTVDLGSSATIRQKCQGLTIR